MKKISVVIADDERPAREFLKGLLENYEDIQIVGEAKNGAEAVSLIKTEKPDLALIDLQMPELSGLDVVKALDKDQMPLVVFVTAFDEYAVKAFEVNAVDYLLKPIEIKRLSATISRVRENIERTIEREQEADKIKNAVETYEETRNEFIERIPVKKEGEILLVPTREVASIIAEGELLHITTGKNEKHIINFRLKDIEKKLAPEKFVRLSRGALANIEMFERVSPMPGGTYQISLKNGQEISSSRQQSKLLRERLLKL